MTKDDIQKYIDGLCSEKETEAVEHWILENINTQELDEYFKDLLDECEPEKIDDSKDSFIVLCDKLGISTPKHQSFIARPMIRWIVGAAAVLAAGVLISTAFLLGSHFADKSEIVQAYAKPGETKMITLPDSTILYLKSDSYLTYDATNFIKKRNVQLIGDAYLEVVKDPEHPFTVKCDNMEVTVLGTKFNVQSPPLDKNMEVLLFEGKVNVKCHINGNESSVTMSPGNILYINKQTGELTQSKLSGVVAPRGKQAFYFVNENFDDISRELERYYNTNIIIKDNSLLTTKYFAIFVNNESLDDILMSFHLNVLHLDRNTVEVSKK